MRIVQQIFASSFFSGLHDVTHGLKLVIAEVCAVLQGSVVGVHVLLVAMSREKHLAALCTVEGSGW